MPHLQNVGVFEDLFGRQRFEVAAAPLAGIVDQHVDAAPDLRHLFHELFNAFGIGHVDRMRDHGCRAARFQVFRNGFKVGAGARTNGDARALGRKGPRDCAAASA
jgi:hypothetical protein